MSSEILQVPIGEPELQIQITLFYIFKWDPDSSSSFPPLLFLQAVRNDTVIPGLKGSYEREVPRNSSKLKAEIENYQIENCQIDVHAVLTPPSTYCFAKPYLDTIKPLFNDAHDVSGSFTRDPGVHSDQCETVEQYKNCLHYSSHCDLTAVRSLLIVDDVLNRGRTVAAVVLLLREHGLPARSRVFAACPLWISPPGGSKGGKTSLSHCHCKSQLRGQHLRL